MVKGQGWDGEVAGVSWLFTIIFLRAIIDLNIRHA
jgi:hypothetical protein